MKTLRQESYRHCGFEEREQEFDGTLEAGFAGYGRQGHHLVDLVVEPRMLDHGDEELGRSQRMTDVRQFPPLAARQDVINERRNVVHTQFVPSSFILNKKKNHFYASMSSVTIIS